MKLLLADLSFPLASSSVVYVSRSVISRTLLEECKRDPHWDGKGDQARKQLLSGIMTTEDDVGSFRIEIGREMNDKEEVGISVLPCFSDTNILRSLVEKFQEKAKVSVYLKLDDDGTLYDFLSMEGMKIDPDTFTCVGSTVRTRKEIPCYNPLPNVRVTFVADIEEVTIAQTVLEKESFSDVIISAGNGVEIKAHKSFLSVCSPVLDAMFRSQMEESQTGRVDMSDLSEEGLRAFLRYVYFEDLQLPRENIQVAFELFYASHKYNVPGLEADMGALLAQTKNEDIDVGLAFRIYGFAKNIENAVELKIKALQILTAKWDELELLQEYQDMFEKSSYSKTSLLELCRDLAKKASS